MAAALQKPLITSAATSAPFAARPAAIRNSPKKLRRAQRDAELAPLNSVRQAAKRSWRAGVWLMERADTERYAAKNARKLSISQLRKYNAALVQVLKAELHDRMLYRRMSRLFNDVLHHCVRQIAAARDPFPIPPELTREDSWLANPSRWPTNSASQADSGKAPPDVHQATPSQSDITPPNTDTSWLDKPPFLPVPRISEQAR